MDSKLTQRLAIYSGVGTLITTIGYVIEQIFKISSAIPYGYIFSILLSSSVLLGLMIMYISIQRFQIEDIKACYNIKIFNIDGDTTITRTTDFSVNNGTINNREHTVYSDGAIADLREFNLKAWDKSGKELFYKITLDKPTMKKYLIYFPESVSEDSVFTYTDQFSWKKLLNVNNDYWLLSDSSKNIEFGLTINKNWHVQSVIAEEVYVDGTTVRRKAKSDNMELQELDFIKAVYKIKKHHRHTKVKVEWNINTGQI